jgi:hypothetical protein
LALRRAALWLALVLVVLAALEAIAFAAFFALERAPFSFARLAAERAAAAGVEPPAPQEGAAAPLPAQLANRVVHPYVGYVLSPERPRVSAYGKRAPVNAFGWASEQGPLVERADDRVIVAILGGSVAGGFAGVGAPRLERLLSASPRFAGRRFVFVPLALAGYKQPQQLMALAWLLALGGEFDLAINLDGFNEVALHPVENARNGTFAAYPRQWRTLVGELPARPLRELEVERERRARIAEQHSLPGLRHSMAASLVWRLRDRRAAARVHAAQETLAGAAAAGEQRYAETGPARPYADADAMMRDLAGIWRDASLQLDRLCRGNGIAYFHFLQPNQYVPGSKPLNGQERRAAFDPEHPYRRGVLAGYPLLAAAGRDLAREGVAFTDLSGAFAGVNDTLYVDDCCHYNVKGYERLADAMADAILARLAAEPLAAGPAAPAQSAPPAER